MAMYPKNMFYTSESVTEGRPIRLCDERNSKSRCRFLRSAQAAVGFSMYRSCWKVALVLLLLCAVRVSSSDHSKKPAPPPPPPGVQLTGRFVGWIEGPRLTSFGPNYDSLIFAVETSPQPTIVKLSYGFMLFEPQVPKSFLEYTKLYTIYAIPDKTCSGTLENMARRYQFNSQGDFEKVVRGVAYARDVPPLDLPWSSLVQCYVITPDTVIEIQSLTN